MPRITWTRDVEGVERAMLLGAADFRGLRVVDIGCGDGRLTWTMAEHASYALGVEPSEEFLELARAELPDALRNRVELRLGQAEQLELPPAEFDLALFSWSL